MRLELRADVRVQESGSVIHHFGGVLEGEGSGLLDFVADEVLEVRGIGSGRQCRAEGV